jgi:hypothetical protein
MPLRDLTQLPKIVTRPCSVEEMQREIGKLGKNQEAIVNNINQIQGDNNLILNVDGGGTVPMQAKFAKSLGDDPANDPPTFYAPAADNGWRGLIKALPCDDSGGTNPDTQAIWVVLPGRDDISITLPEGNIFAYELANSGEYVIVSDYSEARGEDVLWGIAQSDSVDTPTPKVVVRKCDDITGANPVAPNLDVLLPPHDDSLNDVKTGDVIAYTTAKDGTYVAVSDYTKPERIRWVKCTADADTISGVPHTVTAQFCDNADGDNPAGAAITVLLPRCNFTSSYVKDDDVLAVERDDDGNWVCVSDYSAGLFYENDSFVGTQPRVNFIDTDTVSWTLTEDDTNGEVEVEANVLAYPPASQWWIQFTLTTDMSGGSATADVDDFWNGPDPGASVTVHDRHDLFRGARGPDVGAPRAGAKGIAHWDDTNDDWVIVNCQSLAGWIWVTLTEDMAAVPMDPDGLFSASATRSSIGYAGSQQDVQVPDTTVEIWGVPDLSDALESGAKCLAFYDSERNRYWAVPVYEFTLQFCTFTLLTAMSGGSATADVVTVWGAGTLPAVGDDITVTDPVDCFKHALTGADGIAVYNGSQWVVLECETKAGWLVVQLTADMAGSPPSASASMSKRAGSQQDVQDPSGGSSVTVYGIAGISDHLQADDTVVALFDAIDNKYYCLGRYEGVLWARTQANWTKNSGDPRVSCKIVPSRTSSTVSGSAFNVYLPRTRSGDPNVVSGVNLGFMIDKNGDAVCVTDYMDEEIGCVQQQVGTTARSGWALMDGTANASGNGGSGVDMRHRFLRSYGGSISILTSAGDGNSTSSYKHNHFLGCVQPFDSSGAVVATYATAEFYAFGKTEPRPDTDGVTQSLNDSTSIYTYNEDPMFVALAFVERLDNAS